jgi:hypothetical protein
MEISSFSIKTEINLIKWLKNILKYLQIFTKKQNMTYKILIMYFFTSQLQL